jgi:hypothetical protein
LDRQTLADVVTPTPTPRRTAISFGVLAGIVVAAFLMTVMFTPRVRSPSTPAASTPAQDHGQSAIYVVDPSNHSSLQAYDWRGRLNGRVNLPWAVGYNGPSVYQEPDGSGFVVGNSYVDRFGNPVAEETRPHCLLTQDPQTYIWTLGTKSLGQPERHVADVARDQGPSGPFGLSVAACNFTNDIAILIRWSTPDFFVIEPDLRFFQWPSQLWSVRLSDGKMLAHRLYQPNALSLVVASQDGSLVAESSWSSSQHLVSQRGTGESSTVIRRTSDWSVVATFSSSTQVILFSGDDSTVLVTTQPETEGGSSHLADLDWRSGRTIWSYAGQEQLTRFTSEPKGKSFALALHTPNRFEPSPCGQPPLPQCSVVEDLLNDVVIVQRDATTVQLPDRYYVTW